MAKRVCDATLCTDDDGKVGHVTALVSLSTGAEWVSVPVGECSNDRVTVWHGMSDPAIACGIHAGGRGMVNQSVFRGHRNRLAQESEASNG